MVLPDHNSLVSIEVFDVIAEMDMGLATGHLTFTLTSDTANDRMILTLDLRGVSAL